MRYLLIILLFSSCRSIATTNPPPPTNVLFILADDLVINALGCYGNEYVETPNIDRLAREGMRFTNGYSADPTCAPSRGSIVTGQYVPRHGVYRVSDRYEQDASALAAMRYLLPANHRPGGRGVGLDPAEVTLAEAFKAGGYATAGFGKWHLGRGASAMEKQGFDQAVETTKHYGLKAEPDQTDILTNEYNADYTTRKGIAFMKEMKAAGKPFFLYMPYFLVHKPLEPKPAILAHFKKKYGDQLSEETLKVLAMIKSLDESVGQLLAALRQLGVEENTLVAFVSDNGHYKTNDAIFNRPYRGNKGQTLEGGSEFHTSFGCQAGFSQRLKVLHLFCTSICIRHYLTWPASTAHRSRYWTVKVWHPYWRANAKTLNATPSSGNIPTTLGTV